MKIVVFCFWFHCTESVSKRPVNNKPALGQIFAWRRKGDKPLSKPMIPYITYAYLRHSASMG